MYGLIFLIVLNDDAKLALSDGFRVTLVTEWITRITDSKRQCPPVREYPPFAHGKAKTDGAVRQQCGSTHKTDRDGTAVRKKGRSTHELMGTERLASQFIQYANDSIAHKFATMNRFAIKQTDET